MSKTTAESPRSSSPRSIGCTGSDLLREVEWFIRRFVVLPPKSCLPVALWAMATHVFDEFDPFPYLAVSAPTKRAGKSRLLQVLELLVSKPRRVAGLSEAALFRLVEAEGPTILLDEAEGLRSKGERAETLRQLLNAGHAPGACVYRCIGPAHELRAFKVFSPKAFACIGPLPETLGDRSISIPMQRKHPSESVERFSRRRTRPESEDLRGRILAWPQKHRADIAEAYNGLCVNFLGDDRAADNFEPLFALLFVADLRRFEELRASAEWLTSRKAAGEEDDSLPLRLLADVRQVWRYGQPAMFTSDLLARLRSVQDAPWAADVELNARKLSRWLRGFGTEPRTVRVGTATAKGYHRQELEDAFLRYLASNPSQASQASADAASEKSPYPSQDPSVTDEKVAQNPLFIRSVTDVTDAGAPGGGRS